MYVECTDENGREAKYSNQTFSPSQVGIRFRGSKEPELRLFPARVHALNSLPRHLENFKLNVTKQFYYRPIRLLLPRPFRF